MNMTRIPQILIALLLVFTACKKSEKITPSGLNYTVIKEGDGVVAKKEELVVFNYVLKDSKDSVWHDTYEAGMPQWVMVADTSELRTEDGLTQLFRYLSKGDSVKVHMPISKFFKDFVKAPVPPQFDSTTSITYTFNVVDIRDKEKFGEYRDELIAKKTKNQVAKDEKTITEYLEKNKIKAERDSTGLYYVMHKTAGGARPTIENCVGVRYSGKLMKNGNVFDKQDNITFPLTGVIPGWQIAIPKLGIGDSATFYIPSALAYGPQGIQGHIPPDAILIFDVALSSVGKEYDRATRTCN
jgi:FKBP-type peptidyl-prolyl cis-trans isomerase FkpA